MKNKNLSEVLHFFTKKYGKDISKVEQFCIINSPCFCLKFLGNFKSGNNVLTLFSDKFLKHSDKNICSKVICLNFFNLNVV